VTASFGWQPRPPLNIGRLGLAGARAGGRIIVAGGYPSASFVDVLHSVERLDPGGVWTEGGDSGPTPMPTPRGNAAAAALRGRIYVIGGYSFGPENRALDVVESYDPRHPLSAWTTGAPLPVKVGSLGAARVSGRIYAGGGSGDDDPTQNRVWAYDPADGSWSEIAPMNTRRALFRMAGLDGKLYAIGGGDLVNDAFVAYGTVERYDPKRPGDGWKIISPMHEKRVNPGVLSAFGRIFVVGGGVPGETASTTEMFDPTDGHWHLLTPLLTPARGTMIAARQGSDMLAVSGGTFSAERGRNVAVARVDALRIDQPDQLRAAARTRLLG
jgi:hypothetical protein